VNSSRKNRWILPSRLFPTALTFSCGGDKEARTLDLQIANLALSQLSYIPTAIFIILQIAGWFQQFFNVTIMGKGRKVRTMKKILVSECLYGGRMVRYDGGDKHEEDPVFLKWKQEGRLIPVCPEVFGGLTVPRTDSQRRGDRVLMRDGRDVTAEYKAGAEEARRLAQLHDVAFCIMKESSPACGSSTIYDGSFSGRKIPGQGVSTEYLVNAGFRVFSEKELKEAAAYLESCEG
jgi:uncharacterized protein YbbK (DUF523 family)